MTSTGGGIRAGRVVVELFADDSRTVSRDRAEFTYTARGSSDPMAVKTAGLAVAPAR